MEAKARILLADDDYYFGLSLQKRIVDEGYDVTLANNGEAAWKLFRTHSYDLCLLDVVMPLRDGLELTKQIRNINDSIPILFLTSKVQDEDVLKGFKAGADGYIKKPFSMNELLLRMEVFLKRSRPLNANKKCGYKIGSLSFNYPEMQLLDGSGKAVKPAITQREADLLKFFCEHANKLIKREEILFHVWGKDDYFLGRSMDVFITKIRKRFALEKEVELITFHGIGFKFAVAPNAICKLK